jgi:hypothetical protein
LELKKQGNTIFPAVKQVLEKLQLENQYPRKTSDNINDITDKNGNLKNNSSALNIFPYA